MPSKKPRFLPPHLRAKPGPHAPLITADTTCDTAPATHLPEEENFVEPLWSVGQRVEVENLSITSPAVDQPGTVPLGTTQESGSPITPPATRNSIEPQASKDIARCVFAPRSCRSSVTTPNAGLVAGLLGKQATALSRSRKKARPAVNQGWIKHSDIPPGENHKKKKKRDKNKWFDEVKSRLSGWRTETDRSIPHDTLPPWSGEVPVLDWDVRQRYEDSELTRTVQAWQKSTAKALCNHQEDIDLHADPATKLLAKIRSESWLTAVVPAHWIPEPKDQTVALFWRQVINSKIMAVDDGDLDIIPWWKRFPPRASPFQQLYEEPAIHGIDPDETAAQRQARIDDHGAATTIERRKEAELAKMRRRTLTQTSSLRPKSSFARNKAQPKVYIRTANREDMPQVCSIYNHHINFSAAVDETEPITEEVVTQRWRKSQLAGLPMLVACERAYKIKGRRRKHGVNEITIPEEVVGFAFLSNYSVRREAYRHTKRVQVFIHCEHFMRGIGTCLLDKLLEDEDAFHSMEIRSLVVHYLYDTTVPEKFTAVSRWLSRYDFGEAALVPNIAEKHDKQLSLAIFQRSIKMDAAQT